jgi:recombinational DNA repair ATPase RecF
VRIDGKAASQTDLARVAPVLWLIPAMDRLWTEGAEGRRRFLDRATMSFTPAHAEASLLYEKAMRERNRLLKESSRDGHWYAALEGQMARAGTEVARNREAALARLMAAQDAAATAFPAATLAVTYPDDAPPPTEEGLARALERGRWRDLAAGRSLLGPHRADLDATYAAKGVAARDASTGEQKALLISLILANARALREDGTPPLLLLDEVAAHLDPARRAALYDEVVSLGAHVLMTGTEEALFAELGDRAQASPCARRPACRGSSPPLDRPRGGGPPGAGGMHHACSATRRHRQARPARHGPPRAGARRGPAARRCLRRLRDRPPPPARRVPLDASRDAGPRVRGHRRGRGRGRGPPPRRPRHGRPQRALRPVRPLPARARQPVREEPPPRHRRDGGFAELVVVPVAQAHVVPGHVGAEAAALTEPLACTLHGVDLARVVPGMDVTVLGGGVIGLMAVRLAVLAGARVRLVTRSREKQELGLALGADEAAAATEAQADAVLECAGVLETVAQSPRLARAGGTVVLLGVLPAGARVPFEPFDLVFREVAVLGSFVNPFTHARAAALIASGEVDVRPLISRRLPLEDAAEAIANPPRPGEVRALAIP